jgi:malate synthase
MGGMAAQIPQRDPERNAQALAKVRADKEREAADGHDGTWVAHPALVTVAREVFDRALGGAPNQIQKKRADVRVRAEDLLAVPEGAITEAGLRANLGVGIAYLEAWLRGSGCVPLHGLMEDAATAEISRAQVWQWLAHRASLDDGRKVDAQLVGKIMEEELAGLRAEVGKERTLHGKFELAASLFERLILRPELEDFLTLAAYEHI